MMQSWESDNQIYMVTDLQIGPVEPSQHVCRHVAKAPWHVIFIWVGLVGEGWGQRKGGGQASKQVSHHLWLNP